MQPESSALRDFQTAAAEAELALAQRLAMSPRDLSALSHVMFAPEPIGPRELSTRLGITAAGGSDVVDRLEAAGHLHRGRHPSDGRRVALGVSEESVARVLGELQHLIGAVDGVAEQFSSRERAVIRRFLKDAAEVYRGFSRE